MRLSQYALSGRMKAQVRMSPVDGLNGQVGI